MLNVQQLIDGQVEPLSEREKTLIEACESKIATHQSSFIVLGHSLGIIQNNKLYRDEYPTFEEYVLNKWDYSSRRAYEFINAFKVVLNLCAIAHKTESREDGLSTLADKIADGIDGETKEFPFVRLSDEQLDKLVISVNNQTAVLPRNEAQARKLSVLMPMQQSLAWQWIVNSQQKEGAKMTASFIEQAINKMLNKKAREAISKSRTNSTDRTFSDSFQLSFSTFLASLSEEVSKADQKDRDLLAKKLEEIIKVMRGK